MTYFQFLSSSVLVINGGIKLELFYVQNCPYISNISTKTIIKFEIARRRFEKKLGTMKF